MADEEADSDSGVHPVRRLIRAPGAGLWVALQ